MNPIFTYDQSAAIDGSSGGGQYITESCVTRGFIEQAKWVRASSGALGLELSFESERGQRVNFLTVYYQKKDGQPNSVGVNQIQALMGVTGVQQLSRQQAGQDDIAPELTRKPVELALERENYTKGDNSEGFRFQIKCFMSARSGLTVSEAAAGGAAESKAYWIKRFADNPRGQQSRQPASSSGGASHQEQHAPPSDDFDDDIPF